VRFADFANLTKARSSPPIFSKPVEEVIEGVQVKINQHWSAEVTPRDGRRVIFILHPSRKYYLKFKELQRNFSKWATFLGEGPSEGSEPYEARR